MQREETGWLVRQQDGNSLTWYGTPLDADFRTTNQWSSSFLQNDDSYKQHCSNNFSGLHCAALIFDYDKQHKNPGYKSSFRQLVCA
jgi:hypothetical protein